MSYRALLLAGVLTAACPLVARGQIVPFYNYGGAVAYQPVVDTILTGTTMSVRPTVSHDRRYVTIGGSFTQSGLIRLETFPVVAGAGGFVGGAVPAPVVAAAAVTALPAQVPSERGGRILRQAGMIRVD